MEADSFAKKTLFHFYSEIRENQNFQLYAFLIAALLAFLTFVLFRILLSKAKTARNILLVGLSDSGKTVLFSHIFAQRYVETVTSMKVNEAEIECNKKCVNLIDLPGYERLRHKFWDDFKNTARGVIFVIDSSLFMSNIRDVAEFLYDVIADPVIHKKRVPILIACNKQDEPKAKTAKVIQNQLEKEINAIRETKTSALSFTDEVNNSDRKIVGDLNKDFQFSDLKLKIEFGDCTAIDKGQREADISCVWKWMSKVV
ncbi:signal recognition particle receptor subunit beta-like protein [Dinothrombium tinctorium]|uniref:ADP-ribosylation factor-related protein 1 n=1 Tax=Dinothrombium tinctorium TaxID=1965070 RepID=A0A443QKG9_9ACAR|nr:signal recognition particle receptor subunit beta-like protein [Dinothrombium tinctorium]